LHGPAQSLSYRPANDPARTTEDAGMTATILTDRTAITTRTAPDVLAIGLTPSPGDTATRGRPPEPITI
jgi:hypothetical protein